MTALGESRQLTWGSRKQLTEWPLYTGDLNQSMQHLDSEYREEDVADEV